MDTRHRSLQSRIYSEVCNVKTIAYIPSGVSFGRVGADNAIYFALGTY